LPTYGYECNACKEQFEVFQRITEAPLATHEGCGGGLRRLLYPVGIVFKGAGFYVNDYARKGSNGPSENMAEKSDKSDKSDKAETKSEASSDTKSETKSELKSEPKSEAKSDAAATKTD
jgi:putative FmdB family regulatory protein